MVIEEQQLFQFGDHMPVESLRTWLYPAAVKKGPSTIVRIAEVPGTCPGLICKIDMGRLKIGMLFDGNVLLVNEVEHPLAENETGHQILELTDFEPSEDPRAVWKKCDDNSVGASTKDTFMLELDEAEVSEALVPQAFSNDLKSAW